MSLLSKDQICARKDEVFLQETFAERCCRAAAYDLRVRADAKIDTTGNHDDEMLDLEKGQRAVLETYECICMPWDLAGNIGVKYRLGIQGLFVSPGLFVDPGFGWREDEATGEWDRPGDRLRIVVTNIGEKPIEIRLGINGDHVIALQFFDVQESKPRRPIDDIRPRSQGVAFFEDLTKMKAEFDSVAADSRRTRRATELVVEFGVFLVALTVLGAIASFLLTAVASGPAVQNTVKAVNELDSDRWEMIVLLAALTVIAVTCLVWLCVGISRLFRQIVRRSRKQDVPGQGELAG